jgi:2-polyprenyl-3-methyl-5-hydroxy-6-metoxy-1,4-benzoquinol methylase
MEEHFRPIQPFHENREEIYKDLQGNYLVKEEAGNRLSAQHVLGLLFHSYRPASVLDVGCGLGTWLSVARSLGVSEIHGVEGPWLDQRLLCIEKERVSIFDLESPFDLERRFDLVISLEVAEHLSQASAEGFIHTLVRHGDVVLFSAAIPHQGGHNHVNEQWPDYWAGLFAGFHFLCLDFLRPALWHQKGVYGHLKQNLLLFISEALVANALFKELAASSMSRGPLPLVHPEVYTGHFSNLDQWKESGRRYALLIQELSRGGHFHVTMREGEIRLTRMETNDLRKEREMLSESIEEEIRRGEDLFQQGDATSALRIFEEVLEKDQANLQAQNDRAVTLHALGRSGEAEQVFLRLLERDPGNRDAVFNLVSTYQSDGNNEAAKRILEKHGMHLTGDERGALLEGLNISAPAPEVTADPDTQWASIQRK